MSRVLLVSPVTRSGVDVLRQGRCQIRIGPGIVQWPPVVPATLSAALRERRHTVRLLDGPGDRLGFDELVEQARAWRPDLAVIHATTPTIADDLVLARRLSGGVAATTTILIGVHATARPEEVALGGADYAVVGEPERTVCDLADSADRPGGSLPSGIKGLCFVRDGSPMRTPRRPFVRDLDDLPIPDWGGVDLGRYRMPLTGGPMGVVEVSRGCPFRCTFCTARAYHGGRWRAKSSARVVEEVRLLGRRYRISDFLFLSDTFNARKAWVVELCERLVRDAPGITWVCNSRVDLFDEGLAAIMGRAGCRLVSFGIESASKEVLERAGKARASGAAIRAVRAARASGISIIAYYMLGLPGETEATIRATIELARALDTDFAHFYRATPFPGTELFEQAHRSGRLSSTDWSRYFHGASDVLSLPGLSPGKIRRAALTAVLRYYLRPSKVFGLLRNSSTMRNPASTSPIWK